MVKPAQRWVDARPGPSALWCCLLLQLVFCAGAQATDSGSSVVIWPTLLEISAEEPAAGLWLENRGARPAQVQVRVFAWTQHDGENHYREQDEVVATPPMLAVAPGRRQMIRLSRLGPAPEGLEQAYRVVVDEIPDHTAADTGVGVRFQLRYSLPLFVQGAPFPAGTDSHATASSPAPRLSWALGRDDQGTWLQIDNVGGLRARLTEVGFGEVATPLSEGLFGYVLAGSHLRWPLPADVHADAGLFASINGAPRALVRAAE